jgi:CBS domain-containing protein
MLFGKSNIFFALFVISFTKFEGEAMAKKTVSEIMTYPVVTVSEKKTLLDAVKLLLRFHISGLPVVNEEENLVGVVSELDILNFALSGDAGTTLVSEVMSKDLVVFSPGSQIEQAINAFAEKRIRRVPVVSGGKVVGVLSRRDILREILEMYNA